jgi:hypothetical protein
MFFRFFLIIYLLYYPALFSQNNPKLFINEFVASNSATLMDETGAFEDWIEIYNPNSFDVDISGWYITNNLSIPSRFQLPVSSFAVIPAGDFLVLWASGDTARGPLHLNFRLSREGSQISLIAIDGKTVIDSITFGPQLTDVSYGRKLDGNEFWAFFEEPTPGFSNSFSTFFTEILDPPIFSHEGGFYVDSFYLSISHPDPDVTIIYTLDGSEPDPNNIDGKTFSYKNFFPWFPEEPFGDTLQSQITSYIYQDSILIFNKSGLPNYLTNFSSTIGVANYFPSAPLFKGTVIRAKSFKENTISREITTNSYFINDENIRKITLPVVSIVLSPDELFDYDYGLFTPGALYDQWRLNNPNATVPDKAFRPANYRTEMEKSANFELFETNGNNPINQTVGVRIHGGWSRVLRNKSLRIYARNKYGENQIFYPLFPDRPSLNYKTFILRNSGSDNNQTFFRDAFIQESVKHLNFSTQSYRPAAIFLNGEYWGMLNFRERYDKHYLERVFGVDPENVDVIRTQNDVVEGDNSHYISMLNYISTNDLADPQHFEYLNTQMDIESFLDYFISQIYVRNTDWPGNNIGYWRLKVPFDSLASFGHDGRWRWMMYDTDLGFGEYMSGTNSFEFNSLKFATEANAPNPNPPWSTFLLRELLKNQEFRNKFILRFADLINSTFFPERLSGLITEFRSRLEIEMPHHISRWKNPASFYEWNKQVNVMINFAFKRPLHVRNHIQDYFNLPSQQDITLSVSDSRHGYIKINTIEILPTTPGIPENPYPWTGVYFEDVPVTLQAFANRGYLFSHWEIMDSVITSPIITWDITSQLEVFAVFQVDSSMLPLITINLTNISCNGETDGKVTAIIQGNEAPYYYQWSTGFDSILQNVSVLWDFNNLVPSLSPIATLGNGEAILIGGTSNPEANLNGHGSSDTASVNHAWQTSGYPLQGTNPKTAGVQFNVNTSGYSDIVFSFDQRISNSAANNWVLQYSENVNTSQPIWIDAINFTFTPEPSGTGDTWYNGRSYDFSSIKELNDNPNVGFRIVSDFAPGTAEYLAARSTSTYNGGTSRFDMVTVKGNPIVTLSSLEAGDYAITVTDKNGLTITETVSVSEPEIISANVTTTEAPCYYDGTASVELFGGTPPYSFNWSNGDTSQQAILSVGSYMIEVRDNNNCLWSDSVFISGNFNPIQLAFNIIPCHSEVGGAIELTINGGSYPYSINWNTGDTVSNIYGLQEGSYIVTVTDVNNCQISDTVILIEELLIADFQYQTNNLQVSLFNSSTSGSYHWDFGDGNYSSIANPVHVYSSEGSYFVCLTVKTFCDAVSFCDSVAIKSNNILGMDSQDRIQIFPNPAYNVLNVKFSNDKERIIRLDLLNSIGMVIRTESVNSDFVQLNLINFSRGIYFLRAVDQNGKYSIHRFSLVNN